MAFLDTLEKASSVNFTIPAGACLEKPPELLISYDFVCLFQDPTLGDLGYRPSSI
jgi:hypothetical protein